MQSPRTSTRSLATPRSRCPLPSLRSSAPRRSLRPSRCLRATPRTRRKASLPRAPLPAPRRRLGASSSMGRYAVETLASFDHATGTRRIVVDARNRADAVIEANIRLGTQPLPGEDYVVTPVVYVTDEGAIV